jgi:hypothetical protein
LGLQLHILHASIQHDIDTVFTTLAGLQATGLVIGNDPFFTSSSERLAALALRHRVAAIYEFRAFAAAGGLMSYGGSITDLYRLGGVYAGRILNGEKPADLAVQQTTKFELMINLKTAKALGLTVPATLRRVDPLVVLEMLSAWGRRSRQQACSQHDFSQDRSGGYPIAMADRRIAATAEQWDKNDWLLQQATVTCDLRTGYSTGAKPTRLHYKKNGA